MEKSGITNFILKYADVRIFISHINVNTIFRLHQYTQKIYCQKFKKMYLNVD